MSWLKTITSLVTERRLASMVVLGFASGLPFALGGSALQAWLAQAQVDIKTLAAATLLTAPYGLKFLWSPAIDRYALPFLGRRRGWMVVTLVGVGICCVLLASMDPSVDMETMGWTAFVLAFFAATYDIAFDAYRTEVLEEHERGLGVAASIGGWRLGYLTSGGLALVMADAYGWRTTYLVMGSLMLVGIVASVLLAPPPTRQAKPPTNLVRAIYEPFVSFFQEHRKLALAFMALVVTYRLSDAFAASLTTPFLVLPPEWLAEPLGLQSGVGFTLTQVGVVNKGFAFASVLAGTAIAGVLMARWTLFRCLVVFGFLQCFTNLAFLALTFSGPVVEVLAVVVIVENIAGGLGTVALVALIMALCNQRYTATQYALLSAIASLGRYAAATSGLIQESYGWAGFFIITTLLALPGLVLVFALRRPLLALEDRTDETALKPDASGATA